LGRGVLEQGFVEAVSGTMFVGRSYSK
jgi:hypothetical protein